MYRVKKKAGAPLGTVAGAGNIAQGDATMSNLPQITLPVSGGAAPALSGWRLMRTLALTLGGFTLLVVVVGALGLQVVTHAVSGPTCTLRWIGSNAYMTMSGTDADDACQAATGLSADLVRVDGPPAGLPTVCQHPLYADTTVTVRDSGDHMVGSQLCGEQ